MTIIKEAWSRYVRALISMQSTRGSGHSASTPRMKRGAMRMRGLAPENFGVDYDANDIGCRS